MNNNLLKVKIFLIFFLLGCFLLVSFVRAVTIEELLKQITQLQAKIKELELELEKLRVATATYENIPSDFLFKTNLRQGSISNDVKYLKIVLKIENVCSNCNTTNYFDETTHKAVISFQEKYAPEILAPNKLTKGTGFVGISTRTKLNSLLLSARSQIANTPPVAEAGEDKEIFAGQKLTLRGSGSDLDNDSLAYSWSCTGGALSDKNIRQPVFTAPFVITDTNYTCTLTVTDNKRAESKDEMQVRVLGQVLSVSLSAAPSSGIAPLSGVRLTATVSGTASGKITYKFDCANDGIWEYTFSNVVEISKTIDTCYYNATNTYTAKVSVERAGLNSQATTVIAVLSPPSPTPTPRPIPSPSPSPFPSPSFSPSPSPRPTLSPSPSPTPSPSPSPSSNPTPSPSPIITPSPTPTPAFNYTPTPTPTPVLPPTLNLKANNSEGPITIDYNTAVTLSWVATNVTSCLASNGWSGAKATSGSESTGNLTASKIYTLGCTGIGGSLSDSVIINVINNPPVVNAGPDRDVYENQQIVLAGTASDPDGGRVTYSWSCLSGILLNSAVANPTYQAKEVNFDSRDTCSLSAKDEQGATTTDTVNIIVKDVAPAFYSPRVLVIGLNPVENGETLADKYYKWLYDGNYGGKNANQIEDLIVNNTVTAFQELSNNTINFQIVKKIHIEQFPYYTNGFVYDFSKFAQCVNGDPEGTCERQKTLFDHIKWVSDNNICGIAEENDIDEIWLITAPFITAWESFMIGPKNSFYINGGYYNIPECKKHYAVMTANYDRPTDILHIYGHRVEATLDYLTASWKPEDKWQYWLKFGFGHPYVNYNGLGYEIPYCGNCHIPSNHAKDANGNLEHYIYWDTTYSLSACKDWKNFPELKDETENVNCRAWNCDDSGWQKFWFGSLPRGSGDAEMQSAGAKKFFFKKNWWYYLLYPDNAINFNNFLRYY